MEPTIYSRFKELVNNDPDHPAVIDERTCVTYAGLDRLVDTLISRFPSFIPARVGIVMDHSVEMVAAMMAVIKAGAAFVAVEPDFPPGRLVTFLVENGVDFVITQERHAGLLNDFKRLIIGNEIYIDPALHPLPDRSRADRPAYILYSSTPDGYPLGVAVGNSQVLHFAESFKNTYNISGDDILLQFSACIMNIFIQEIFGALLSGAAVAIPSAATRNDPEKLVKFIDDQYVTVISGFPYLMMELNAVKALPVTVRLLISSGDVLHAASIGHLLEQVPVYTTYGPAEATVSVTTYCCNTGLVLPDGTFPIGKPMNGTDVMILDENLREVAPGQEGEICLVGDGLADYYTGDHRADLQPFAVIADGRRVFRTGDMGRQLSDGNYVYLRRKDTEVNILGKKVVTGEVERAIRKSDEVDDCTVVHYTDEQGSAYLVAYVVPKTKSFRLSWVKNTMAQYVPAYMIPEFFVLLKALPTDAAGVVNTFALPVVLKDSKAV
ncbi:AMP-binding protein [uncultured Duncaniella sp.]|uniref:AMP-binding protein n=1 Tax=uncultured Duncaniella sp. TaxID=2768039 RepID=UPI002632C678|nr:AMP-binding protein [uncultured Duncaniella sp.]